MPAPRCGTWSPARCMRRIALRCLPRGTGILPNIPHTASMESKPMESKPNRGVRVDPNEMVRYVQDLMTLPRSASAPDTSLALAERYWGGDTPVARAAQLRWSALNRAFADARL